MDECIDSLGQAKIFTVLDANLGYWQLPIHPEDRHNTGFVTHYGTFQYRRMPFGLTTAPSSFQRGLDMILTNFKWRTCLIYLDDIIIFSNSVEEHIDHVDDVLTCLEKAGVSLNVRKCNFFTEKVEYLGDRARAQPTPVQEPARAIYARRRATQLVRGTHRRRPVATGTSPAEAGPPVQRRHRCERVRARSSVVPNP